MHEWSGHIGSTIFLSCIKYWINLQPAEVFYSRFSNISQGYKPVKMCQEFSHKHHCWSYASLAFSVSITFPWATPGSCNPSALLLQCYCFSLSLLPVSGSWQLVSITVIPQALGCVRLMVHQQVKQQHRSSPTKHSYHQAPAHCFFISSSHLPQGQIRRRRSFQ